MGNELHAATDTSGKFWINPPKHGSRSQLTTIFVALLRPWTFAAILVVAWSRKLPILIIICEKRDISSSLIRDLPLCKDQTLKWWLCYHVMDLQVYDKYWTRVAGADQHFMSNLQFCIHVGLVPSHILLLRFEVAQHSTCISSLRKTATMWSCWELTNNFHHHICTKQTGHVWSRLGRGLHAMSEHVHTMRHYQISVQTKPIYGLGHHLLYSSVVDLSALSFSHQSDETPGTFWLFFDPKLQ